MKDVRFTIRSLCNAESGLLERKIAISKDSTLNRCRGCSRELNVLASGSQLKLKSHLSIYLSKLIEASFNELYVFILIHQNYG